MTNTATAGLQAQAASIQGQGQPQPAQFGYGHGDQALIATIAAALATGATVAAMVAALRPFLYPTGIGVQALRAALMLAGSAGTPQAGKVPGPAVAATTQAETVFRAAYALNAARRLQAAINSNPGDVEALAEAVTAERRYLVLHREAQANRQRAAAQVDETAGGDPNVPLEWEATLDSRTSPECRAADGGIFYADQPPAIGYPGTVHPHCRCRARLARTGRGLTVDERTAGRAMTH